MQALSDSCRICGQPTQAAGRKFGKIANRWFELRHCPACRFSFVIEPWTDNAAIYSEDYYRGRGADPSVDYEFELEHPAETVRIHEWAGLLETVSHLTPINPQTRWLDFGCGHGGLVRYLRQHEVCDIVGFDEGHIVAQAKNLGVPILNREQLTTLAGTFDIITAVEVLEHTVEPVATLRLIRRLLKPGGLLFLTTGNARPFRNRLTRWSYVVPEIHVSFFEPETLACALRQAGLEPEFRGWIPGFEKILRFKILKGLGIRRRGLTERLLPLGCISRAVDAYLGASRHPVAWRR